MTIALNVFHIVGRHGDMSGNIFGLDLIRIFQKAILPFDCLVLPE